MKISLFVAVAAVLASGAAAAQSSATMYGILDVGYGHSKTILRSGRFSREDSNWGVRHGTLRSRIGFKGQEALGDGLRAVFALEMGFDIASGEFDPVDPTLPANQRRQGFGRRAVVGLKGGFGEVLIGRDSTPMNSFDGTYQSVDAIPHSVGWTWRSNGVFYNAVFSGVTLRLTAGRDSEETEKPSGSVKKTSSFYGAGFDYNGGAWGAGAAFQRKKTGAADAVSEYGLGAFYDFGAAKVFAHYLGRKNMTPLHIPRPGLHLEQYGFGVKVPFGMASLSAEYGRNSKKRNAVTEKGNDFAVQANYALSRRTDVYIRLARLASYADSRVEQYNVGIRHMF